MSHGELNLTVGKLPPIFNDGSISSLRELIEDFACFQASGFNWQRESLCLLRARHPVCHIAWTNEHVGTSYDGLLMPPIMSAPKARNKRARNAAVLVIPANHRACALLEQGCPEWRER
jgi:hypothetical protein